MAGWFERAFPNPAFAGPARPAVLAGYGREHGRRGVGRLYGLKIAPTCVGKTPAILHRHRARRKHPHMRGEDLPPFLFFKIAMETPPHAWGRRLAFPAALHRPGNTPTCVGKTPAPARGHAGSWKHPHMRGEDNRGKRVVGFGSETPPHAWGRLNHAHTELSHGGNTPTCVGKTRARDKRQKSTQKHPHMRGEDQGKLPFFLFFSETPPHAWGRPAAGQDRRAVHGNTPTCVGKTGNNVSEPVHEWKHPHMRGEDQKRSTPQASRVETPPHAWGRRCGSCIRPES